MNLPPELTALLNNEAVIVLLIALGLYVTPNKLLTRIPVIGPVAQEIIEAYTRRQIENRIKLDRLIGEKALRIVTTQEQLKRNGTLDSGSAKAQAVRALLAAFTLTPERASDFIEAAVYRLDSDPRPLSAIEGYGMDALPLFDPRDLN